MKTKKNLTGFFDTMCLPTQEGALLWKYTPEVIYQSRRKKTKGTPNHGKCQ